jgi:hypothetical protein
MNNLENSSEINAISLLRPKDMIDHGIVLTALKLEIFDCLKDEFLTLKEIKDKIDLKIRERNLYDFLDKLYFNKHLLREGDDISNVRYKAAHNLLLKSNPHNLIPLVFMAERIGKRFDILPYMIKEGKFPNDIDIFQELFSNEQKAKDFFRTMALLQGKNFEGIAKDLDFVKYRKMVDIGGCLGAFCLSMKKHNPHLECVSFDLPFVTVHAEKYLEENEMSDQVVIIEGDMFKDEFPKCDVLGMGNILHDWNDEKKRLLLKKAYECLEEGGIMIIVEFFLRNQRDVDDSAADMSFNMLVYCLDGFNMTRKEMETYAKEAGFDTVEFLKDKIGIDAAVLYKRKTN